MSNYYWVIFVFWIPPPNVQVCLSALLNHFNICYQKLSIVIIILFQLQCCGAEKPSDWGGRSEVTVGISSDSNLYNIPKSCCREGVSEERCDLATRGLKIGGPIDFSTIYNEGCYNKVIDAINAHFGVITSIGITVIVIQVLGLIFALVLAFAINRAGRYKA